jgi:signal peptidase
MEKVFKIFSKTLSGVLVALVVALAILLGGVRLVGLTPYTVLSGSMEPTYHVGSIIYVSKIDPAELKVGDPVTYRLASGTVVTHRIEEILETPELSFRTKGDANNVSDGVFPAAAVVGKPQFSVPYLGYVSTFVQTPRGLVTVVSSCGIVLALSFIIDGIFAKQKEKEENVP